MADDDCSNCEHDSSDCKYYGELYSCKLRSLGNLRNIPLGTFKALEKTFSEIEKIHKSSDLMAYFNVLDDWKHFEEEYKEMQTLKFCKECDHVIVGHNSETYFCDYCQKKKSVSEIKNWR